MANPTKDIDFGMLAKLFLGNLGDNKKSALFQQKPRKISRKPSTQVKTQPACNQNVNPSAFKNPRLSGQDPTHMRRLPAAADPLAVYSQLEALRMQLLRQLVIYQKQLLALKIPEVAPVLNLHGLKKTNPKKVQNFLKPSFAPFPRTSGEDQHICGCQKRNVYPFTSHSNPLVKSKKVKKLRKKKTKRATKLDESTTDSSVHCKPLDKLHDTTFRPIDSKRKRLLGNCTTLSRPPCTNDSGLRVVKANRTLHNEGKTSQPLLKGKTNSPISEVRAYDALNQRKHWTEVDESSNLTTVLPDIPELYANPKWVQPEE